MIFRIALVGSLVLAVALASCTGKGSHESSSPKPAENLATPKHTENVAPNLSDKLSYRARVVEELRETPTFLDPSDIYSTATFSRVDGEEVRHSQYQGYGWINIRGIFGGMISSDDEEHGDYITLEDVSLGRGSTVTLIPDTAMKVASRISRMNLREGDSIWANCGRLNIMPFKGTSIHAILDGCLISKWPPVGPGVGDIQIGLPSAREGLVRALSSNLADYP